MRCGIGELDDAIDEQERRPVRQHRGPARQLGHQSTARSHDRAVRAAEADEFFKIVRGRLSSDAFGRFTVALFSSGVSRRMVPRDEAVAPSSAGSRRAPRPRHPALVAGEALVYETGTRWPPSTRAIASASTASPIGVRSRGRARSRARPGARAPSSARLPSRGGRSLRRGCQVGRPSHENP